MTCHSREQVNRATAVSKSALNTAVLNDVVSTLCAADSCCAQADTVLPALMYVDIVEVTCVADGRYPGMSALGYAHGVIQHRAHDRKSHLIMKTGGSISREAPLPR
jgi:hypothetical protein